MDSILNQEYNNYHMGGKAANVLLYFKYVYTYIEINCYNDIILYNANSINYCFN